MKRSMMAAALAAAFGIGVPLAHAESFTYHGSLQDAGQPANGRYDMELTLYSQHEGGTVLAGPVTVYGVDVDDGNFVTRVDFGPMSALAGQGWVGVKIKPAGEAAFTSLDARSSVAPTGGCPGSWTLDGNAGVPAGSYLGTADDSRVYVKANSRTAAYFDPTGSVGLAFPDGVAGNYTTAIGYHARTVHDGSVMIGGYNDNFSANITDSASNQFIVASAGGVGINTSVSGTGGPLADELTVAASPTLPASNADFTLQTGTSGYTGFHMEAEPQGYFVLHGLYNNAGTLDYTNLMRINYTHTGGHGFFTFNGNSDNGPITVGNAGDGFGNGAYVSAGGVWTNASSKAFKESFGKIDVSAVLDKLVALPIQTWFYKSARDEGQHMGPFAEDFADAFGLGHDEKHIATVDESGVALAAIQGLNRKVESENAKLRQQNAELQSRLERLAARFDELEGRREK